MALDFLEEVKRDYMGKLEGQANRERVLEAAEWYLRRNLGLIEGGRVTYPQAAAKFGVAAHRIKYEVARIRYESMIREQPPEE